MTFNNNICNNSGCGKPIRWRCPITGQPSIHPKTGNVRPLNMDGSLHLCMTPGQKDYFEKKKKGNRITDYNAE